MSEENIGAPAEATNVDMSPEEADSVQPEENKEPADDQKTAPKKYKVKIDDEELEVDEDEVVRGYQHARAANKKFQEAAAERKAAEQAKEEAKRVAEDRWAKLKTDPFKVLSELGINPRELSEEYLLKALEEEMMSPAEKEKAELTKKLQEYEAKEKTAKEQEEAVKKQEEEKTKQEEILQLQKKYEQEYESQFIKALESTKLPKNPTTIRRIAEIVMQFQQQDIDIPVEHAIRIVEQDYNRGISELVKSLEGDSLVQFLGNDVVDKIRKHTLSKVKNPIVPTAADVKETPSKKKEDPKYVDTRRFVKDLLKKHGV